MDHVNIIGELVQALDKMCDELDLVARKDIL